MVSLRLLLLFLLLVFIVRFLFFFFFFVHFLLNRRNGLSSDVGRYATLLITAAPASRRPSRRQGSLPPEMEASWR